jgi:threonine aldolase
VFHLAPGAMDAATLVARARERGVLLNAFNTRTVRAVTHLDVNAVRVAQAATVLADVLGA